MKTLLATVAALTLLAGSAFAEDAQGYPDPPATKESRIAVSGRQTFIYSHQSISPDCKSLGVPSILVTKAPNNGEILRLKDDIMPSFKPPNVRVKCNQYEFPGVIVYYKSRSGFSGTDYFSYTVVFSDDTSFNYDFKVIVK